MVAILCWLGISCTLLILGELCNNIGLMGAAGAMVLLLSAVVSF